MSAENSPRSWLTPPLAAGGAVDVELEPEDPEVEEVVVTGLDDEAGSGAPELLVAAMKGPNSPPCCCAGDVLFEVLAAFAR